ncbi:MAG: hypothetical protein JW726_13000 [Anaerolineales bacterium]|nr:hypothetical protein [Anaerolineales bacterium]
MSAAFSIPDRNPDQYQGSGLERQLITEYLISKGYRESDLQYLPEEQRKALMKDACIYVATKLANIEAKSIFRRKIKPPKYR